MSVQAERSEKALVPFNPFAAAFSDDPYPAYRAIREAQPVLSLPGCLGRDWVLTRYEDVLGLLRGKSCDEDDLPPRIRAAGAEAGAPETVAPLADMLESWLFFAHEDAHRRLRKLVGRHFTRVAIERRRAEMEVLADRLLDGAAAASEVDLISVLARPFPLLVNAGVVGLEVDDVEAVARLSSELFSVFKQPMPFTRYQALNRRVEEFQERFRTLLRKRAAHPADDLISDLARHLEEGEIRMGEALALCIMLMAVGQDTSQNLIGNGLFALIQNPDQAARLREDAGRLPHAIEELARYDTPVQLVIRIARQNLQVGGEEILQGERLHFFLGAANRDPEAFRDPERLDVDRAERSHLIFGAGAHYCLGAQLALVQAEVAVSTVLRRMPVLSLAVERPRWIRSIHVRGLAALPVRLG